MTEPKATADLRASLAQVEELNAAARKLSSAFAPSAPPAPLPPSDFPLQIDDSGPWRLPVFTPSPFEEEVRANPGLALQYVAARGLECGTDLAGFLAGCAEAWGRAKQAKANLDFSAVILNADKLIAGGKLMHDKLAELKKAAREKK